MPRRARHRHEHACRGVTSDSEVAFAADATMRGLPPTVCSRAPRPSLDRCRASLALNARAQADERRILERHHEVRLERLVHLRHADGRQQPRGGSEWTAVEPPGEPADALASATSTAGAGPWGVSYTANLTPDPDTGLGNWSVRDFIATIRTGRHMGRGRPILPPMPMPVYNNFSDRDLEAIFAYLRTIPPVKNRVPEPQPPSVDQR